MCKLLILFTARVLENGSIDLHHLGEYLDKCGVPPLLKRRMCTFYRYFIRRSPICSYCWFCGRLNPFQAMPETIGLLPVHFLTTSSEAKILSCIYIHRMNWKVKYTSTGSIMPFHIVNECHCDGECRCDGCENDISCPIRADFGLDYRLITPTTAQVGVTEDI